MAFDQPAFEDVAHAAQLPLVIADQHDLLGRQLDGALAPFEIEALGELLLGLLDGVGHFLHVGLRNDVE